LLLDTQAFLWFVQNEPQLSATAQMLIVNPANDVLVSPASYWEIAIKVSLGKYILNLNARYELFMQRGIEGNGFEILPIEPKHTAALTMMPFHHRDPFDRLLIAQATVEQIPIVSGDPAFDAYSITRLWWPLVCGQLPLDPDTELRVGDTRDVDAQATSDHTKLIDARGNP
jgi:PIN domain nuclease of toxin-antitoxin system